MIVSLVPRDVLAGLIAGLRGRYPEARLMLLAGTAEAAADWPAEAAFTWQSSSPRELLAALRARGADVVVLAAGRDYCWKRGYWLALALALLARARGLVVARGGRLPARKAPLARLARPGAKTVAVIGAVLWGLGEAVLHGAVLLCVNAAAPVLLPLLAAAALCDAVDALAGPPAGDGRTRGAGQRSRQGDPHHCRPR